MSTYTDSLGFEEITPGDQAGLWGNTTNNNLVLIDQAISGVQPLSFAGAGGTTITLNAVDGSTTSTARSAVLNITGNATAANTVIVPNKQKTYLVRNNTGQNITFRTASPAPGATVLVAVGYSIPIFCDGSNGVFTGFETPTAGTLNVPFGGTGTTSFTAGFVVSPGGTGTLTSQATIGVGGTTTTQITGEVQVPNGGTGLSNVPAGSLLVGNGILDMTVLPAGTAGHVLTSNGVGANPSFQLPATGVASVSSGGNITVSPTSGNVVITLSGANVTSALGYTPGNVSTNASNTYTSSVNTYTGGANIVMQSVSSADQRITVTGGGSSCGISNTSVQVGASGNGLVYDPSNAGLSMGKIAGVNITCFSSFLYANTDNTQRPTGGPWVSLSDERIKENIVSYTKGLSALNSLRPVNYTLKGDLGEATKHKICTGLVAQEVLNTELSTMVQLNDDGMYTLNANEVTWALVNAVKELKAELDTAKAEITALKAK